ncbi:MAG: class I SAM-dependent methyltransferase [Actinomycetota bacterium]|nr:class I SAM-dependent methyltransferase [Actinomycetota bacterium]
MDVLDRYITKDIGGVQGWLRPEAADLIAQLARTQSAVGAVGEIGVHHGKLFLLLALSRRSGERGVAIDLFEDQEKNVDHSGLGDRTRFVENLNRLDPSASTVTIHSADSTTLTTKDLLGLSQQSYRLFSVDGGHTAGITRSDLAISSGALTPGGLLILDDYFNVRWPGVSEGTNRFLANDPPVVAFATGHGKTFFTHESAVEDYRGVIKDQAESRGWRLTEQPFFERPILIVETRPRPPMHRRAISAVRATSVGRTLTDPVVRLVRRSS